MTSFDQFFDNCFLKLFQSLSQQVLNFRRAENMNAQLSLYRRYVQGNGMQWDYPYNRISDGSTPCKMQYGPSNSKVNNLAIRQLKSTFATQYYNLAPARFIYKEEDFERIMENNFRQKPCSHEIEEEFEEEDVEVVHVINDSEDEVQDYPERSPFNPAYDFFYEPSTINCPSTPSFNSDNEDFPLSDKHNRMRPDPIKIVVEEDKLTEEVRVCVAVEVRPQYKLIRLETNIRVPYAAMRFSEAWTHRNRLLDPRMNDYM